MSTRPIAAAAAFFIAAAGLVAVGSSAALAATGTTLYVDQTNAACSDAGSGSQAAPYCTIQAAADAATAGDTVLIAGSNQYFDYGEHVTITNSGTATAPITFEAEDRLFYLADGQSPGITVSGAQYIDIVGVYAQGLIAPGLTVSNSSHITVGESDLVGGSGDAVEVTGDSSDVTIERSGLGPTVLGSGVSGATLTTDVIRSAFGNNPVSVQGTAGTDITSNTIIGGCGSGVTVASADDTSIENNIVASSCGAPGTGGVLTLDAASAGSTTDGYNIYTTSNGWVAPYSWAGTTYSTVASFQAATGQGAGDLTESQFDTTNEGFTDANPAINSANSSAPGELDTDFYGNPQVDDPSVPNTGVGVHNYYDRGAIAYEEFNGVTLYSFVDGQQASVFLDIQGVPWGADASVTVDWGDGTSADQMLSNPMDLTSTDFSALGDEHSYASRGTYTVTATVADAAQTVTKSVTVSTNGSTYVPVAPTRVLDTREGIGAAKAKIPAGGHVAVDVTEGVTGAPDPSTITAVVMNVTATNTGGSGFITAYPDGGALPSSSNINYLKGQTVPNLVTVKVGADGKVDLHNGGSTAGPVDLIADVSGYYIDSQTGSGYVPLAPDRVLDTRKAIGATKAKVAARSSVRVKIAGADGGALPATGISAVALNVTATDTSGSGFVTAYADGGSAPQASNLNYVESETVPNMVVVPVSASGYIDLYNGGASAGDVDLIADVEGYYTTSGGDAFIPVNPVRELDTRTATGQESVVPYIAEPDSDVVWFFDDELHDDAAVVLNVTVTQPQDPGFITAYPGGTTVPGSSNVNFAKGQTASNLVMVEAQADGNGVNLYNNSKGTVEVIADLFGYFS